MDRGSPVRRQENTNPAFLQLQELYQSTYCPALKNPFSESSTVYRKSITPKEQQKSQMSQSRIGESSSSSNNIDSFNNNSYNTTNSFNNTTNNTTNNTISFGHVSNVNFDSDGKRAEILAWLSPLDPWIRHHDIRAQRVECVGDWVLRTEEYRNWSDGDRGGESDNSALFCYGDPGVGKTYIR